MKSVLDVKLLLLCFLATLWMSGPVGAERILAVSTVPAKSHWNFMRGILRVLTNHGHSVTSFSAFRDGDRANYTEVDMSDVMELQINFDTKVAIETFGNNLKTTSKTFHITRGICQSVFEHKMIKEILLGGKGKFDVVIAETIVTECISSLAAKLGIPLIFVVTPPALVPFAERKIFGHFPNPAIHPHILGFMGVPKTFIQRFKNTALSIYTTVELWYAEHFFSIFHGQLYDTLEIIKPSIVFTNTHHITEAGRPLPLNVIPVAGIHLNIPKNIPNVSIFYIEVAISQYQRIKNNKKRNKTIFE